MDMVNAGRLQPDCLPSKVKQGKGQQPRGSTNHEMHLVVLGAKCRAA